jgi:hypothetical protein
VQLQVLTKDVKPFYPMNSLVLQPDVPENGCQTLLRIRRCWSPGAVGLCQYVAGDPLNIERLTLRKLQVQL